MDLVAAATFGTSDSNLETTGLLLPCCGKAVDHTNTRVWHDGHIGYLCDGKMYCSVQEEEPLMQHQLSSTSPCKLIPRLDSHIHGPDCGHEVVLHDDHYDYLVGEELHHVVDDTCCSRGCIQGIQEQALVRHGTLSVLRHRQLSNTPAKAAAACRRREPEISILTEGPAESEAVVISKIYAAGICCPSEVPLISNLLSPLPGVHKVEVAVMTKTVTVTHKASFISSAALVAALNGARLDASMQAPRRQGSSKGHWIPPWNVLLSAGLLCISLIHYAKGPGSRAWLEQLKWVALASVAIGIPPILLKALAALRNKVLDINMLMTLAVIGAIAIGDYTEAAAVVVLFALAEFFEDRCGERARNAIAEVIALSPATAILAETGEQVSVDQLKIGDLVSVKPGEQVPVDGTVSTGTTRVDQSMLTGEATPVKKGPSDQVLGGTLNVGSGLLVVTATALAADSAVARVASLVEQAAGQQSPTETLVARFAKWYTPTVVFACLLLIVIPAAVGAHLKDWVYLSLQVLVTACPCALVLSTPVVVVTGLARAAHEGVLIKGGRYLELLAKAKIATFDKTGTLTQGRFQVVHSEAVPGGEVNSMLQLAGCLERTSAHPVAAAIVGHAASLGLALDLDVSESEEVPGQGVIAHVAEHVVAVGNVRLMTDCCAEDVAVPPSVAEWSTKGATVCCVAVDGQLAGFVAVADTVRDEAAAAVAALRKQGVVCGMLTGDGQGAAAAIASAVGLDAKLVHSQLLPEDKLDLVEKYKREYGALIHVGDGVNDAPALAAADIGIAMGVAGSAMAIEAADVALFTNDLQCLAPIIGLARSAHRKILQNIALSVVTKVAVLVLASVGKFTLWGAVLVDVGTALVVMLNGFTLLRWSPKGHKHSGHSHGHSHKHGHKHDSGSCCSHKHSEPALAVTGTEHPDGHSHKHGGASCCSHKHSEPAQEPAGSHVDVHQDGHSHKHGHKHGGGSCCSRKHSEPALAPAASHGDKPQDGHSQKHGHSHGGGSCCSHKHSEPTLAMAGTEHPDGHSHKHGGASCCSHKHSEPALAPAAGHSDKPQDGHSQKHGHKHGGGSCCSHKRDTAALELPNGRSGEHKEGHDNGGGSCCGHKHSMAQHSMAAHEHAHSASQEHDGRSHGHKEGHEHGGGSCCSHKHSAAR